MKFFPIGLCLLLTANLLPADPTAGSTHANQPVFISPQPGSLIDASTQAIYGMLAGLNPSRATLARFSDAKLVPGYVAGNTFIKNQSNWAASVDLTCISVYNDRPDGYGLKFQTTAISPRHGIGPAHTSAPIGTHYNWLASDGTTITRKVIAKTTAANDIEIYLFDSDLPPTISPAKMLPPTWTQFLGVPANAGKSPLQIHIPVIMPTQESGIYVNESSTIIQTPDLLMMFRPPSTDIGRAFSNLKNGHNGIWSGDSGFTAGIVVNGGYVPIVEWHFGGSGSGPFLPAYYSEMNAAMHKLSQDAHLISDYRLTPVDLSHFSAQ
ncbi:MAG: hypothetical protein LV479_05480 [Methylacidiphilales bacterium]|nr:hypothetical protein [Candidatus Methylacidiphilales bacterium]